MANIPLKSIKFPDLADTYTVPSNAGEIAYTDNTLYPNNTVGKVLGSVTDVSTTSGYDESDNLVDGLSLISGYISSNGSLVSNANFSHLDIDVSGTEKIKVDGTHHIYTTSEFNVLGTFFDADNTVVGTIADLGGQLPSSFPYEANVPQTAVKLSLNTDYKASEYPSSLPSALTVYPWATISAYLVPYSAIAKEPVALQDISSGSKKIKIVAGVIRNSGDGWKYINDAGHEPLNLDTVSVDEYGRIVIGYTFTAKKVLSLVVCPDETFANLYAAGGSVGLSSTDINVYRVPVTYGGRVLLSSGSVNTTYGTFTSGTFNTTTGEIKLFHPTVDGLSATQKFNISATPATAGVSIALGSQGNDYVSLYLVDSSGNIIKNITDNSYDIYVTRNVNATLVDANDIVNAGGNFWIYGVMEI